MQTFDQEAAAQLKTAFEAHRSGLLAEAEAGYRRVLARFPEHPETLNFAGYLAHQMGDRVRAVELLERSIELAPENPHFISNLAKVQQALGRHEAAAASYRRALALNDRDPQAHYNLALVMESLGQSAEAEACYRRVLEVMPREPRALVNLGNLLKSQDRLEEAMACYGQALDVNRKDSLARRNLGLTLWQVGRLDEAERCFRKALRVERRDAASLQHLGGLAAERGMVSDAIGYWRRALEIAPEHGETLFRLSQLLLLCGAPDQAASCLERMIELEPEKAEPLCYLAHAQKDQGMLAEAEANCARALALSPDLPLALSNLALVFKDEGRIAEALELFDRLIELAPDNLLFQSNRLMTMQYSESVRPEEIFEASKRWAACLESEIAMPAIAQGNRRDADRRLRIGYVSPDFRRHSVSYFFEPLLAAHDGEAFEITCYAEVGRPDQVTARLKALAHRWRDINCLEQETVAEQIRADEIDILIDLAGHTALSRLPLFALKPAPLQFSWCGYPGTTGLAAIGYRLTDGEADPPGESDRLSTERLLRLESGFLCYGPPQDAPPVAAPPCVERGYVTFGSFNNLSKLTPRVVETWSKLLSAVPNARLVVKSLPLADAATRERYAALFESHGIAPDRLEFLSFIASTEGHLGAYAGLDIALDPFPYNGTTTTCEALWMGVPVVCLRGNRHASRVGASLLTRVGLTDMLAESESGYIDIAARLAASRDSLVSLRHRLRDRLAKSPLCNAAGFARAVERSYRDVWRRWCEVAR